MKEFKQLSIFMENKQGRLAEVTSLLASHGVDIRALSVADTTDYGVMRLIVDNPDEALSSLKDAGLTVALTNVIAVAIEDTPGSLDRVVKLLSANEVWIEYMYAFLNPTGNEACVILRVENNENALKVLSDNNIPLIDSKQIYD